MRRDTSNRRNQILEVCEQPGRVWDPVGGETVVSSERYLHDISDKDGTPQLPGENLLFGLNMAVAMRGVREDLEAEGVSPDDDTAVVARFLNKYPDYESGFYQLP